MTPAKQVLIIEDNPDAGMLASLMIERSGLATPRVVEDGLEGLTSCFRDPPDALVLDLELPSMRGEEILRILRTSKEHRHLPILVVSSLPDAKRKELELLQMGADQYMDKPFLEKTFLQVLGGLLERRIIEPSDLDRKKPDQASRDFISEMLQKELDTDFAWKKNTRAPEKQPAEKTPKQKQRDAFNETPTETALKPGIKAPPPDRDSQSGDEEEEVYNGYRILGVIGSGGMGTVYRAVQLKLHRVVALKILLEEYYENAEMRERFHREALIMAQINHPNIVQVYETGRTEFSSFFSMEFVDGNSLSSRIRRGTLDWQECPNIIRQACNAIAHLHQQGVIHRDIKPSNILISKSGLVKVTDFGISQARLNVDRERITQVPQFMGTPDYMAPELQRLSEATAKTDLYALGMTFWRMFAGHEAKPLGTPLYKLHPEIPQSLSDAIAKCIALDPQKRYSTVLEARDAILEACKGTFSGTWEQFFTPIV